MGACDALAVRADCKAADSNGLPLDRAKYQTRAKTPLLHRPVPMTTEDASTVGAEYETGRILFDRNQYRAGLCVPYDYLTRWSKRPVSSESNVPTVGAVHDAALHQGCHWIAEPSFALFPVPTFR